MPSRVTCLWLEPTDLRQLTFRRYVGYDQPHRACGFVGTDHPGRAPTKWDYHNANVEIEQLPSSPENNLSRNPTAEEKLDPRWPVRCGCGYLFQPTDSWQWNTRTLYRRSDTSELVTLWNCPAGSIWNAPWMIGHNPKPLPDGMYLIILTPHGEWNIDGPRSNNKGIGWVRKGVPPKLIVTPSIGIGEPQRMHGWLGGPSHNEPGILVIDRP